MVHGWVEPLDSTKPPDRNVSRMVNDLHASHDQSDGTRPHCRSRSMRC